MVVNSLTSKAKDVSAVAIAPPGFAAAARQPSARFRTARCRFWSERE